MTMIADQFEAHVYPYQRAVPYSPVAGTSGTYQATTYLNFLHRITCSEDVRILAGTGASVTATAGEFVKAGVPFFWVPTPGRESFGWLTTTTAQLTAAVVETARVYAK